MAYIMVVFVDGLYFTNSMPLFKAMQECQSILSAHPDYDVRLIEEEK